MGWGLNIGIVARSEVDGFNVQTELICHGLLINLEIAAMVRQRDWNTHQQQLVGVYSDAEHQVSGGWDVHKEEQSKQTNKLTNEQTNSACTPGTIPST